MVRFARFSRSLNRFLKINCFFFLENASMIALPEDVLLEGFPLITSAMQPIYCLKTEKKKSMLLWRLHVILDNGNKIFSVYNPSRQKAVHVAPQSSVNTKVNLQHGHLLYTCALLNTWLYDRYMIALPKKKKCLTTN